MHERTHCARSNRRGFTLIEIVVVVTVLSIMAGAVVPVAIKAISSAARKSTREELTVIGNAATEFFRDTSTIPTSVDDLEFDPKKKGVSGWSGPYLPGTLTDPATKDSGYMADAWSQAYKVDVGTTFKVTSAAEGGAFGTDNDISIEVDFTPVRREKTVEKMKTINQAIQLYNGIYQTTAPLSDAYKQSLSMLVNKGFLPDFDTYYADAWGTAFVADPAGKSPLVKIGSSSMTAQAEGKMTIYEAKK